MIGSEGTYFAPWGIKTSGQVWGKSPHPWASGTVPLVVFFLCAYIVSYIQPHIYYELVLYSLSEEISKNADPFDSSNRLPMLYKIDQL